MHNVTEEILFNIIRERLIVIIIFFFIIIIVQDRENIILRFWFNVVFVLRYNTDIVLNNLTMHVNIILYILCSSVPSVL